MSIIFQVKFFDLRHRNHNLDRKLFFRYTRGNAAVEYSTHNPIPPLARGFKPPDINMIRVFYHRIREAKVMLCYYATAAGHPVNNLQSKLLLVSTIF